MCGRFALVTEKRILEMLFEIEFTEDLEARYNIAPSQMLLALRRSPRDGQKELTRLQWGLLPSWAVNKPAARLINIRAETAATKFGAAFRQRRALIPASGFYEWYRRGKHRQPYYIHHRDGRPFAFGGLYESGDRERNLPGSGAIITTAANSLIAPVHQRMPLIVPVKLFPAWLDPDTPVEKLQEILVPYPAEKMGLYPVSSEVGNPAFDHPGCLCPLRE